MELTIEQKQLMEKEVSPLLQQARSLVVKNVDQKSVAVSFVKKLKEMKDRIEEIFHPTANRAAAHKQWQALKDTENAFYEPLDLAIEEAKKIVNNFDREESIRVQREAEAAEARRQEEERKEREKLEKKSEKELAKGNVEKAEMLKEQAATVTAKPIFTPPADVKKLIWKARVINPLMACKSIGEGLIPFNAVEFKQSALNDLGKGYDGKSKIPGIEFYQDVNSRVA